MTFGSHGFGELVRGHRLKSGLTQRDLAAHAGISLRGLRDLEAGRVMAPRARSVYRLATALGLDDAARDMLAAAITAPAAGSGRARLRIGVLGTLTLRRNDEPLEVGAAPGALLGLLAIQPHRAVGREEIIEALWGGHPPDSHRRLIQVYVAALRHLLEARRGARTPARTLALTASGYLLAVDPDELDLIGFDECAARGSDARLAGDAAGALDLFDQALALWRGPVLGDAYPRLRQHPIVVAIGARRVAVTASYADLAIQLDLPDRAVVALRPAAAVEPLHEGLAARLVLALAATGQRAAALTLYAEVRARLADDLGIGPGPELARAQLHVLREESGAVGPTPAQVTTPAQLPAEVSAFTGRTRYLRRLDGLLPAERGRATVLPVVVLTGIAGVGKTSLAVRWAHRVRDRFPDGQLVVDLRGYARVPPLGPLQVLASMLLALGVPAERVPVDQEQAAGMYRSMLAGKRVLVVLDNAHDAEQVRPMLPGTPGCFVLITSRDRFAGLAAREGAHRIAVSPLSGAEARTLLARTLGARRTRTELQATADLAECCAGLPLALRVVAANLADQPDATIAGYLAELRAGSRLAAFVIEGDEPSALRGAFDLSYVALADAVRRLFRLLSLVPGPDVTVPAAAALAGTTADRVAPMLERLASANLLVVTAPGRYSSHDLLRLYAAERSVREDEPAERAHATQRLHDWYLAGADAAARLLYPEKLRLDPLPGTPDRSAPAIAFDRAEPALGWLDRERANLIAAVRHAAEHGPHAAAWRIADVLRGYFILRRYTVDWLAVASAGLVAAQHAGDLPGEAASRLSLADAYTRLSRYEPAIEHYLHAIALAGRTGSVRGQAAALGNLGGVYQMSNRLPDALNCYRRSLALNRQVGRASGQATPLLNLGTVYWQLGRLGAAASRYRQALALYQQVKSPIGEGCALGNLGELYHARGRLDDAQHHLTLALALHRHAGNRGGEADALRMLAEVRRDANCTTQAYDLATTAVALTRDTNERRYEADALNTLASVYDRMADHRRAIEHHRRAQFMAREVKATYTEVVALLGLAAAHHHLGQAEHALTSAQQAATIATQAGFRPLVARAQGLLAEIYLAGRRPEQAAAAAAGALAIFRDTGYRLGEAQAQLVLDGATRSFPRHPAAVR